VKEVNYLNLNLRKLKILEAVVDTYITSGEPVSSNALCDLLDFSISSATIRNELAELTKLGLLDKPHISAGRVPSHFGYRVYVNQIMNDRQRNLLLNKEDAIINAIFSSSICDSKDLIHNILDILAETTGCVAVLITPTKNSSKIKNIQLILEGKRVVLVMLITSFGIIKNKLVRCDYELTPKGLQIFQEILQKSFQDKEISSINEAFKVGIFASLRPEVLTFLSPFINAIFDLTKEAASADLTLVGQTNLFFCPEFEKSDIRQAVEFLNSTEDIIKFFLENQNEDIKVLIGEECGLKEFYDLSVIMSKYEFSPHNSGIIAIIGPTRMDYAKLISSVQRHALAISYLLSQLLNLE
jgi:heat-inducible transcriptional repressor